MNERLKEINDFVDEHFPVSREKNTLNYNKYFDYQLQNNLLCRYDVDKLNNIEKILCIDKNYPLYQFSNKIKYCFYEIKYYNKNIDNMTFDKLTLLYVSVILCLNKKLIVNFFKKYLSHSCYYEQYMNRFCNKKQRNEIYNYIKGSRKNYSHLLQIIQNTKPQNIILEELEQYKTVISDIKEEISRIYIQLTNLIDKTNNDHTIFHNIINTYQNKIDKIFKFTSKFNNPEMIIYNFITEKSKHTPNILNIFTHFKLPVKRNKKKHSLIADLLVVLNIENDFHFLIIEYDGPTHDNINDFRFIDSIVYCDITKNNFCVNNNISLIRLHYKISITEHLITIDNIIKQIIVNKKPTYHGIPSDNHYEELLHSYYNK